MYGKILGIIKKGDPMEDTETRYLVSVPPVGDIDIPESAMSLVNETTYLIELDTGGEGWIPESYLKPVEE